MNNKDFDKLMELDFHEALLASSDQSAMFKIEIGGKEVSFGGKRVWKTEGAAKTALTNAIHKILWNSDYWARCNKTNPNNHNNGFDWQKIAYLTKSYTLSDKKVRRAISKFLLENGTVKIYKCR